VSAPPAREPAPGWLAREVEAELPGLRVLSVEADVARPQRLDADSPADVEARMRALSSRFRGGRAITLRREPVPSAYRVFFRHIGLDPDVDRTPIEAAVLERMLRGGFPTGGLLEDVLLIALLDTGVPVYALDAGRVEGPLGIRTSRDGEPLGRSPGAQPLAPGRLVVADADGALAVLFAPPVAPHTPAGDARRLILFAVQVAGVPSLYADEALWCARSALEAE
jgi:DNA/RNA-binding domain of Phe-tRNA-synthetase-like protein